MRHLITLAVVIVMGLTSGAWGERCIGPMDNSSIAQSYGVVPITQEEITWCDDFDSYCADNALAESRWPGYPPDPDNLCATGSTPSDPWFRELFHWPLQDLTGSSVEVTTGPSRWEGWDGNPGWITTPFVATYQGGGNTTQYHVFDLRPAIAHRFPNFDALNGTDDTPLILRYWMYHSLDGAPPNSPLYVELKMNDDRAPTDYVVKDCMNYHDCNCADQNPEAYCDLGTCDASYCQLWYCGVNNTCQGGPNDGQPCTVQEDCGSTCAGGPHAGVSCITDIECSGCVDNPTQTCWSNEDCNVCVGGQIAGAPCSGDLACRGACGPGQQSVCDGGPKDGQACQADSECAAGPYLPIVNQQWLNSQIGGITTPIPHPPAASFNPADPNYKIWSSLAFGMLAQLDRDPCDLETGRKPTMYHAATFDGNRWYDLRSNVFPGNGGDFNNDWKQAFFELKIKSQSYELRLVAGFWNGTTFMYRENLATIARRYTGPFNRIGIGTGPGCELAPDPDPVSGLPVCLGSPGIWTYPGEWSGTNWHNGHLDRIAVLGGVPGSTIGACCMPDGPCVDDADSIACNQAGGVFRGMGTVCDPENVICTGACCKGEVSGCTETTIDQCQPPFLFQGPGTQCATAECPCSVPFADADLDGDVDQADFAIFQSCFAGSGVAVGGTCKCFDRHPAPTVPGGLRGDNDVDVDDWDKFELCASGPGIPLDPACDLN